MERVEFSSSKYVCNTLFVIVFMKQRNKSLSKSNEQFRDKKFIFKKQILKIKHQQTSFLKIQPIADGSET